VYARARERADDLKAPVLDARPIAFAETTSAQALLQMLHEAESTLAAEMRALARSQPCSDEIARRLRESTRSLEWVRNCLG
jgi:hypothetical protein